MTETMRAAVLAAPQELEVRQVPLPRPQAGQVRVRLQGCGICASNLPPWEGREWFEYPFEPGKPGHEGWGVVDAVGEGVEGLEPGCRVAFLSDNAYAEYDVADAAQAVPLPDSLDGRPFPGEPLGCALNVFRRSGIRSGQTVAVVGVGFLGALVTQLARAEGARVIGVSRREFSLQTALRAGARQTVPLEEKWRVVERVEDLTDGDLCDVVVEATGLQEPLDVAAELTAVRGRLVIAGYHQDGLRQVDMQLWNWRGLDVINAHERDPQKYVDGIRQAVHAVSDARLDPTPFITHRFPLQRLDRAFRAMRDRPDGFLKGVLEF